MDAREMAREAVYHYLLCTGETPGEELRQSERVQAAYDRAWENFLDHNDGSILVPEFCIVEEWVDHFLRFGDV